MSYEKQLKRSYANAVEAVSAILYQIDPVGIGIGVGSPADEYSAEAGRIVAASYRARDEEDLAKIVRAVFDETFEAGACSPEKAGRLAREIWPRVKQLQPDGRPR